MGISAHRITKIEHEFSFSFTEEVINELGENYYDRTDSDGCGIIDVPVEILQKIIDNKDVEEDIKEAVGKDIESSDSGYVQYYCF